MKKKDIVHDIHQVIKDLKEYDHSVVQRSEESGGQDGRQPTKKTEYRISASTIDSYLRK